MDGGGKEGVTEGGREGRGRLITLLRLLQRNENPSCSIRLLDFRVQ